MIRTEEEHLAHYGILRKSGRYPWGSGGSEVARSKSFLDYVDMHRKDGMTDTQIAQYYGMSRNDFVATRTIANARKKADQISQAQRLKNGGNSNVKIGERMGLNESSVRALLAPGAKDKVDNLTSVANKLKDQVDEKGMIDVGKGVESQLGITKTKLDTAVSMAKIEGYTVHNIKVKMLNTRNYITMKVLARPGTTLSEVQRNRAEIKQIQDFSDDQGRTWQHVQDPISLSSRRIGVNYGDQGGSGADGVIYIRPGVKDLSIGNNSYAQVRIMVDGTHYLKGMAVYKDDLPLDGPDLVFNTKQLSTGRKKDVMKDIKEDKENPFGSIIHQVPDPDNPGQIASVMNIVGSKPGAGEEGSWDTWSRTLSSQMLSKQDPKLAQGQLDMTFERRRNELDEIQSLTNPTVRKDLLLKFADQTDAAAVHLKAAALPRQANRVLMPIQSMKPTEIYAPTFRNGEPVVLIRHPHGGTFEIPQLRVNNKNEEARRLLPPGPRMDAIGIHHTVAQHLSGADFDGDHVLVIPNKLGTVKRTPALEELKGFDPIGLYKIPDDSPIPRISVIRKEKEMGKISNLITDMTIQGAPADQIARAVKHSMVVIDSEKHGLDFLQSEKDQGILALKQEYQGGKRRGAATLISRAGAEIRVEERVPRRASKGGPIDPVTGRKVFEPTGRKYISRKTGEPVTFTQPSKRLVETEDAFALSSGTRMESIYAAHSNKLKAMANDARKQTFAIKANPYNPEAKKQYADEVASLNAKLNLAEKNSPLERHAHLIGQAKVGAKRQANPGMERAEVKKLETMALNESRITTGANKERIKITQSEWDAIQAGALSRDRLERVLKNADADNVKKLAMPKTQPKMTSTKIARAQAMAASGYTQAEIADHLGVGLTTLKEGLSNA